MKLKFMTPRQAKKDQHTLKEKIEKKEQKKQKSKLQKEGKLKKRKGSKEKVYGKGSDKVFNRRPPMFSYIRLRKRQQCCKPKIAGETLVNTKLSSESSKDQIQYRTMYEKSIM